MINHSTISAAPVSTTSPWIVGAAVPCGSPARMIPGVGLPEVGDPARRRYGAFATA